MNTSLEMPVGDELQRAAGASSSLEHPRRDLYLRLQRPNNNKKHLMETTLDEHEGEKRQPRTQDKDTHVIADKDSEGILKEERETQNRKDLHHGS